MSRTHVVVERIRAKFDGAAQRALNERRDAVSRLSERNRRSTLAEAAKEDLERLTASLPENDAEIYRAELRRLLEPARPERKPSARAIADAHFTTGREAA